MSTADRVLLDISAFTDLDVIDLGAFPVGFRSLEPMLEVVTV